MEPPRVLDPAERELEIAKLRTGRVQMRIAGVLIAGYAAVLVFSVLAARNAQQEALRNLGFGAKSVSVGQMLVGPAGIALLGVAVFTGSRLAAITSAAVVALSYAIVWIRSGPGEGLLLTLGVLATCTLGLIGTRQYRQARQALEPGRPPRSLGWGMFSMVVSVANLLLVGIGSLAVLTGFV